MTNYYIVIVWFVIALFACGISATWYMRKSRQIRNLIKQVEYELIDDFQQIDITELSQTSSGQELLALFREEMPQVFEKQPRQKSSRKKERHYGGLIGELIGYPKLGSLLLEVSQRVLSYLFFSFTLEGKISQIPRKVETIESVLELRKKLMAMGIDTAELDENIQNASEIIAKETNRILIGETRVNLSDKVFTIKKESIQKYQEAAKGLFQPKDETN